MLSSEVLTVQPDNHHTQELLYPTNSLEPRPSTQESTSVRQLLSMSWLRKFIKCVILHNCHETAVQNFRSALQKLHWCHIQTNRPFGLPITWTCWLSTINPFTLHWLFRNVPLCVKWIGQDYTLNTNIFKWTSSYYKHTKYCIERMEKPSHSLSPSLSYAHTWTHTYACKYMTRKVTSQM